MKPVRRLALAGALWGLAFQCGCALVVRPEVEPKPGEAGQKNRHAGIVTIDSSKVPTDISSPYWDKIRNGGPLVIGINRRYPPFGAPAKAGGDRAWVGFDVELARLGLDGGR